MIKTLDAYIDVYADDKLKELQQQIDLILEFSSKIEKSNSLWNSKSSSPTTSIAFKHIRDKLSSMCTGSVRCAYCEDSLADDIDHINPKSMFPQFTFKWNNYVLSCPSCNRTKSSRYGIVKDDALEETRVLRSQPLTCSPIGESAFINPRTEDPLDYFDMDLGGTTPNGEQVKGTFNIIPRIDLDARSLVRALFTRDVLKLNRDPIRDARENAYLGYRARITEYDKRKKAGAPPEALAQIKKGILTSPHLTVFEEMKRQYVFINDIKEIFDDNPEIIGWSIF